MVTPDKKEESSSFLKKENQKTIACQGATFRPARHRAHKSSLVLFFKKE
jgi:hypothetical protein